MTKTENIRQYQEFCRLKYLIEDENSASLFCELFRRKETKSNGVAIAQINKYIDTLRRV